MAIALFGAVLTLIIEVNKLNSFFPIMPYVSLTPTKLRTYISLLELTIHLTWQYALLKSFLFGPYLLTLTSTIAIIFLLSSPAVTLTPFKELLNILLTLLIGTLTNASPILPKTWSKNILLMKLFV